MSLLSDLFGSKPSVPNLPKLNLGTEQQTAIGANQAALPSSEALVGAANQFTQSQISQMLQQAIPNYSAITGGATSDIESLIKGQIPTDVNQAVQSSAAAQALGGGYGGSGMHGDLVARDLGLTSLDLINKGINSAQSWISNMDQIFKPGMLNVSSMFISPAQQAQFDFTQNEAQFQRQWMQNQINAMPDPVTAGLWNTGWSVLDSALSAYTGSNVDFGRIQNAPAGGGSGSSFSDLGSNGLSSNTNFDETTADPATMGFFGAG